MRETPLSTSSLVLREGAKFFSSSQNQCKNPGKEVFPFLLYLKGDRKTLTSQPCALSKALCGDPNVDRCCDLFSLAPGVGVVNHLCGQKVKQTRVIIQPFKKRDLFVGVKQVVRPAVCGVSIGSVVWQQIICPCPRLQGLADCLSHILKLHV